MTDWKSLIFPHPVKDVKIIETHISCVILTGVFAYKIKKRVNFGFVDFSTLEKRKHFCYEELRLNKRLAPEIYLDVVRIDNHFRVNGDGEVIEYAVKMVEFSQGDLLDNLALNHQLKNNTIDQLSLEISEFHRTISSSTADQFGSPETIEKSVFENFNYFANTEYFEIAGDIQNWSIEKFEELKDEMFLRKKSGFIRECHGDLHLGNIALINDRPVLFDCIEFNENLRWIDVISEIAFLMMDMEERGLTNGAYRFINRYLELTGDYAGLKLLTFYLSYRAMVRAKVAVLQGGDPSMYLNLANSFTLEKKTEMFITHGLSGSGKSFFTSGFLEEFPAIRIRSDVERKRIQNSKSDRYSNKMVDEIYSRLLELSGVILKSGFSVIVDATFLNEAKRNAQRLLAYKLNVKFTILDFECPVEVLESRIRKRSLENIDPSEADLEVLRKQISNREALTESEKNDARKINCS